MLDTFENLTITAPVSLAGPNEFINCHFKSIDFNDADLSGQKFLECQFSACNFSNAVVLKSSWRSCHFYNCKLLGINWSHVQAIFRPQFEDCLLNFCVFSSLNLSKSSFKKCSLKDADFFDCKLGNCDFGGSDLSGAQFTRANLFQSDLRGAQNYTIDPGLTVIKQARFSLPEALSLLRGLDIVID